MSLAAVLLLALASTVPAVWRTERILRGATFDRERAAIVAALSGAPASPGD